MMFRWNCPGIAAALVHRRRPAPNGRCRNTADSGDCGIAAKLPNNRIGGLGPCLSWLHGSFSCVNRTSKSRGST